MHDRRDAARLRRVDWSDSQITATVPSLPSAVNCTVQQRGQPTAHCGELEITAANGKKSIDTVTVTVGGKTPTVVTPTSPSVVDLWAHRAEPAADGDRPAPPRAI